MVHLQFSGSPLTHTLVAACDLSEFKFHKKEGKRKAIFLSRLHLYLVSVLSTCVGCRIADPFLSSSKILMYDLRSNSFNDDNFCLYFVAHSGTPVCNPMNSVAFQAPLSMGILQTRILKWVALISSGDLPNPGIETRSPVLQAHSLPPELPGKPKNTGVEGCFSSDLQWLPLSTLYHIQLILARQLTVPISSLCWVPHSHIHSLELATMGLFISQKLENATD